MVRATCCTHRHCDALLVCRSREALWHRDALMCVADTTQMVGITTARYFIMRKREDGVVAFWYKPCVAHRWLYPSKKDPITGEPLYTRVDDEVHYDIPCPYGIEIFKTREGPSGVPPLAEFPLNKDKPYLDVDLAHESIIKAIEKLPELFGPHARVPWDKWKQSHPRTLADVQSPPAWELPIRMSDPVVRACPREACACL